VKYCYKLRFNWNKCVRWDKAGAKLTGDILCGWQNDGENHKAGTEFSLCKGNNVII